MHPPVATPRAATTPPPRRRREAWLAAALAALAPAAAARHATATDLPPALVADFTRSVQPLLLNKCAAGACHGGASAHQPRFQRAGGGGQFDRGLTLANIATLDECIRSVGSPATFLAIISARHPAAATPSRLELAPLTPAERAVLERWITAATERRPRPFAPVAATPISGPATRPADDAAVTPAAGRMMSGTAALIAAAASEPPTEPTHTPDADIRSEGRPAGSPPSGVVAKRPNRFRAMLDAAANPPVLPPPEPARGVLLRDTAP